MNYERKGYAVPFLANTRKNLNARSSHSYINVATNRVMTSRQGNQDKFFLDLAEVCGTSHQTLVCGTVKALTEFFRVNNLVPNEETLRIFQRGPQHSEEAEPRRSETKRDRRATSPARGLAQFGHPNISAPKEARVLNEEEVDDLVPFTYTGLFVEGKVIRNDGNILHVLTTIPFSVLTKPVRVGDDDILGPRVVELEDPGRDLTPEEEAKRKKETSLGVVLKVQLNGVRAPALTTPQGIIFAGVLDSLLDVTKLKVYVHIGSNPGDDIWQAELFQDKGGVRSINRALVGATWERPDILSIPEDQKVLCVLHEGEFGEGTILDDYVPDRSLVEVARSIVNQDPDLLTYIRLNHFEPEAKRDLETHLGYDARIAPRVVESPLWGFPTEVEPLESELKAVDRLSPYRRPGAPDLPVPSPLRVRVPSRPSSRDPSPLIGTRGLGLPHVESPRGESPRPRSSRTFDIRRQSPSVRPEIEREVGSSTIFEGLQARTPFQSGTPGQSPAMRARKPPSEVPSLPAEIPLPPIGQRLPPVRQVEEDSDSDEEEDEPLPGMEEEVLPEEAYSAE